MRTYFRHLPYRHTEGVIRAHAGNKVPSSIPHYSTINRRVNQVDIKINEHDVGNDIVIAIDRLNRHQGIKWKYIAKTFSQIHFRN